MKRQNCWEFMQCGREEGGTLAEAKGVCPAARAGDHDGENGGSFAGRACWKVQSTLCGGAGDRSMIGRVLRCLVCPFYQKVSEEEGLDFQS